MATLADSLVSSSSRRLPIRKRPDLSARRQRYQGRIYWVVKEPVGLNYFRFEEEEFAILNMLDGESSLDEIVERFEAEFPPQTIRVEELQQFIGMLHKSGLVITAAPGQGVQLRKRRSEKRRKELIGTFTNVLAIRFKGFDPERLLNRMYPYVRWFFSKPMTIINLTVALLALLLVTVQFDVFRARLPDFESFFAAKNWLWLGIVLAVTKVIHEFGHGMSCKHFGGECHEMGVMFLVLTPCLYCNVSDSWMLPNRWHRAAIGAAGMYVEIVIASIATFLWWFSEPGPLNFLCLNIMFVSSVSTILFNANPLLRYDGYYILSDIVEIPNLRQKASTILTRKMGHWCLGLEEPEDPFLPKRNQWLFAVYTIASIFYRWFIVISILLFLNKVFEPYGLKPLGQMIALVSMYGLFVHPFWKLYKYFSVPGRLAKVKKKNLYITLVVVSALVAGVYLVPFPAHVYCELELQPRDSQPVYVAVEGTLQSIKVEPGQRVAKGEVLATLSNLSVDREIARLEGTLASYQAELRGLEQIQYEDASARGKIATTLELLDTIEQQLGKLYEDRARLTLTAPQDGVVIPPPLVSGDNGDALPQWSGSPLQKRNLGAFLTPGERGLFCRIGEPGKLQAELVIDQSDLEDVEEGQQVEMVFDQEFDRNIQHVSYIESIASEEMKSTPQRLSSQSGGSLASEVDDTGRPVPLSTSYEAMVPIDDPAGTLRVGLTGTAKIQVAPKTIWTRIWRYISHTFSFEL